MVNIKKSVLLLVIILFYSCINYKYNKREFLEFSQKSFDLNRLNINGYYINEYKKYNEFNNEIPKDSICYIHPIVLHNNGEALVTDYTFNGYEIKNAGDFSKRRGENSFEMANLEFLKYIKKYNLGESKFNNGVFRIDKDTITIKYYRGSSGNLQLVELKGIIESNTNFIFYQRKIFRKTLLNKKYDIHKIKINYKFKTFNSIKDY